MAALTVAIMQPTYLPWLGYFDLIDRSDCFVFLDSVQFNKRSWQQRNCVIGEGGVRWLTVPVLTKGRFDQRIEDVEIDETQKFPDKHVKTIRHFYSRAPFLQDHIEELAEILGKGHRLLAKLDFELIHWLCGRLGIEAEMVRSSELGVEGSKGELLVEICRVLNAGRYLSPEGSRDYLEGTDYLEKAGIELTYQHYRHPRYRQLHGDFVSHVSVVDLLLNEGSDSLAIIRRGRGNSEHRVDAT